MHGNAVEVQGEKRRNKDMQATENSDKIICVNQCSDDFNDVNQHDKNSVSATASQPGMYTIRRNSTMSSSSLP